MSGGLATMVICGESSGLGSTRQYRGRIEKVKFGVPVSEALSEDIPPTLLVLLLKVNKEGPSKKDIWRAPGNQAQVRKLQQVMQHGRLVNIANFSVYTAASVIKKFLAKIPQGIFGPDGEERLFRILNLDDPEKQRETFCRVVSSLPVPSQHLLVLLFGTWRLITDAAEGERGGATRMSAEAMGISVAPSVFLTCIQEGQSAKIEDVVRFRKASSVLSFVIKNFGSSNLFPRDCYEYYARITGRTLRVDENWQFTFQYPAISGAWSQSVREMPERERPAPEPREEAGPGPSRPFPPSLTSPGGGFTALQLDPSEVPASPSLLSSPEGLPRESRFHSVGEMEFASHSPRPEPGALLDLAAESSKSLSHLEFVHDAQTRRMRTRSEWFLSPVLPSRNPSRKKPDSANPANNGGNGNSASNGSSGGGGGVQRKRSWRSHYVRPKPPPVPPIPIGGEEASATLATPASAPHPQHLYRKKKEKEGKEDREAPATAPSAPATVSSDSREGMEGASRIYRF